MAQELYKLAQYLERHRHHPPEVVVKRADWEEYNKHFLKWANDHGFKHAPDWTLDRIAGVPVRVVD